MKKPAAFDKPMYITKTRLPTLEAMAPYLEKIWEDGRLTNGGPFHQELEQALSSFLRVPHLSLFVNGTLALQLACASLRLSGEVITTPFTFAATSHALFWNNITPVFCDIEPEYLTLDPSHIESLITPRTTAILPVHVFGNACDVEGIQDVADRYGLNVIYDAAHAFGVTYKGKPIGTFGDISMFSFHATKLFHTIEGGALTYRDEDLGERLSMLRNFGIKDEETIPLPGTNAKMNELQAVVGLLVLDLVNDEIQRRKHVTSLYHQLLAEMQGITCLGIREEAGYNYPYLMILVDERHCRISRDTLYKSLKDFNIFARRYHFPLCSDFPCYHSLPSAAPGKLPVAEKAAQQVLCLPLFSGLKDEDVLRICDVVKYIYSLEQREIAQSGVEVAL